MWARCNPEAGMDYSWFILGLLNRIYPTPTLSETLPTACRCVVNFHNRQNTLTCLENPYSGFNQIEKRVLR